MINILFIVFIVACTAYLLFSRRKEVALFIIFHAFIQYIASLGLWIFHMNSGLISVLLGFMVISTSLLLWGRSLTYSREHKSLSRYFITGQWALLLMIGVFISIRSPYYYLVPSASWHAHINPQLLSIHPFVKISANAFIFASFFLLILNWGQQWSVRKSILVLSPGLLYITILVLLRFFQTATHTYPFA